MICAECKNENDCGIRNMFPALSGCAHGKPKDQPQEEVGCAPIPAGFEEIENVDGVFISDSEIVITGIPDEDDEEHDCDDMGCSSVSHVLFRATINRRPF